MAAGLAVHVVRVRAVGAVDGEMEALRARLGLGPAEARPRIGAPVPAAPVRAFVPIWRRPWMTLNADTYGSSLLAAVGVANVFADAGDRYPEVTLAEAAARRPDVVVAPSEPYPFGERHVAELSAVAPVELVDGRDLFWWGWRTPAALDRLAARLGAAAGRA